MHGIFDKRMARLLGKDITREARKAAKIITHIKEKAKPVKLDAELYSEIVKIISKKENKYRYTNISAFINEAVYEKIKQIKERGRAKTG